MKITKRTLLPSVDTQFHIVTPHWRIEHSPNAHVFKMTESKIIVLEGDLFYSIGRNGTLSRISNDNEARVALKEILDSVGHIGLPERLEGTYNLAVIDLDNDSITVMGDAFSRVNLFYSRNEADQMVSTEIRDMLASNSNISYDPAVLSCLLILGYPPAKHTPYRGIYRLAVGESLLLENGRIQLRCSQINAVPSADMGEADLNEYAKIYQNAVLSRASNSENWVSVSGGWDSTMVLGELREHFDKSKVRAVVSQVKLRDGRVFNPYEVEKALKIAKYYDVPVEIANIDLESDTLNRLWNETVRAGHSDFIYTQTFLFQAMTDVVRANAGTGATLFLGSFADSLHNFGFAQGGSLGYLSNDFRNYSDKMMSYLYSPSFLGKVLNNKFKDDFVYKLFVQDRASGSEAQFSDVSQMSNEERIYEYLLSFILSSSRLPFAPFANERIFSNDARRYLKDWLWENYFKGLVAQFSSATMYSCLTWLYEHFHLQGFERGAVNSGLRGSGVGARFPFYDLRMVRFLERMPESWGRGLEWRLTKYPLKHYGKEKLKVPYDIIEHGVHSYIIETEEGKGISMFSEILNNSVLAPEKWKKLKSEADFGSLLDKEWFDSSAVSSALDNSKSGSDALLSLRLLLLSTIKDTVVGIPSKK